MHSVNVFEYSYKNYRLERNYEPVCNFLMMNNASNEVFGYKSLNIFLFMILYDRLIDMVDMNEIRYNQRSNILIFFCERDKWMQ